MYPAHVSAIGRIGTNAFRLDVRMTLKTGPGRLWDPTHLGPSLRRDRFHRAERVDGVGLSSLAAAGQNPDKDL